MRKKNETHEPKSTGLQNVSKLDWKTDTQWTTGSRYHKVIFLPQQIWLYPIAL